MIYVMRHSYKKYLRNKKSNYLNLDGTVNIRKKLIMSLEKKKFDNIFFYSDKKNQYFMLCNSGDYIERIEFTSPIFPQCEAVIPEEKFFIQKDFTIEEHLAGNYTIEKSEGISIIVTSEKRIFLIEHETNNILMSKYLSSLNKCLR